MFDSNNIIGQQESDGSFGGGDSTSWHGAYTILEQENRSFRSLFEKSFGGYVRHPDEGYSTYYNHPWDGRITRDQLSGILAALIHQKDHYGVFRCFVHHMAWLWLFDYATRHNGLNKIGWKWPDLTGPNIWCLYLRGMFGKFAVVLYPLLMLLDFHDLFDGWHAKKTKTEHVISWTNRMMACRQSTPTIVSNWAFRQFTKDQLLEALSGYWCDWRKNCFLIELYEKKFDKLGLK